MKVKPIRVLRPGNLGFRESFRHESHDASDAAVAGTEFGNTCFCPFQAPGDREAYRVGARELDDLILLLTLTGK